MNDVLVLGYHSVSESWPAVTNVTPSQLEEQLAFLVGRGFRGATLADALIAPPHAKTLVVTFDDAHRSVLEHGHPILERLGLPGTVFAPTRYADSGELMAWPGYSQWLGGPHEGELACLGWDELGGLVEQGWEVGSHTRSHPRLPTLDDASLAAELSGSRERCEEALGRRCSSIAYPYSDFDARVARATAAAGYAFAVTIPRRRVPPLPLQWPRVGIYRDDTLARFRLRILRRTARLPARAR